jgi:tetratricopeptide (TPR) repeat protein
MPNRTLSGTAFVLNLREILAITPAKWAFCWPTCLTAFRRYRERIRFRQPARLDLRVIASLGREIALTRPRRAFESNYMVRCEDIQRCSTISGISTALVAIVVGLLLLGCGLQKSTEPDSATGLPPEILSFIRDKETHARSLARELDLDISSDVWAFFATAQTGSVTDVTNAFERLKSRAGQYTGSRPDPKVTNPVWQTVVEVELAVEAFAGGDPRYSLAFGRGVIDSIPPGSIYFGGTDPGRGLVTALSRSHAEGDPVFTLTQNALADRYYLDYLRATYGDRIQVPDENDSRDAFEKYLQEARRRKESGQLLPGEQVDIVADPRGRDRIQVSGNVSVMAVNALLVKRIFEANEDREFFIEESFPLTWTYPHLTPHGYIFKLNREPLDSLPAETVRKDREFWLQQQKEMIGDWLVPETTIEEICVFARTVFGRRDFHDFTGDRSFVEDQYAHKLYSKLRASMAGMYWWRATNASNVGAREWMTDEAEFAYRQAFAMCPYSPETTYYLVQILTATDRFDDALRLAETALNLQPENEYFQSLVSRLKQDE